MISLHGTYLVTFNAPVRCLYSVKDTLLSKELITEQELEMLQDECLPFEKSEVIIGFFSNILVSGIK